MKLVRSIFLLAATLMVATPVMASPITLLIGDKDWFGIPGQENLITPWTGTPSAGITDNRSAGESTASNGAQLTDLYSALFFNYGLCNPLTDAGCSPNKDAASVIFPFVGTLNSGAITIRMGDFQCALWGAIAVNINGISVDFCFNDGVRGVETRTFTLTSQMLAAANLAGAVSLNLDHHGAYADPAHDITAYGSVDYYAFDFFELNGDLGTSREGEDPTVPEPAPLALVTVGLIVIGLSSARGALRARLRLSAAARRR